MGKEAVEEAREMGSSCERFPANSFVGIIDGVTCLRPICCVCDQLISRYGRSAELKHREPVVVLPPAGKGKNTDGVSWALSPKRHWCGTP
jgi:hypothetical protein